MNKTIVLFSGGKDSYYSLLKARETGPIAYIVSVKSQTGDTQLHAGSEVSEKMRRTQLNLIGLPYKEMVISSEKKYLHELFIELNKLVQQDGITSLITGDLWHPYTSGIGDMLAGALGVKLVRPAREACPFRESEVKYIKEILSLGIKSIIISIRQGDLPEKFLGREINEQLIKELISRKVDPAAEKGEYQSFVVSAPKMNGSIVVDNFDIKLVNGKNGKEKFYRMSINKFHIIK